MMARKKTTETIDAEIKKVTADMTKPQERYGKLAEKLKVLQDQKRKIESEAIMATCLKSGKSFNELMTFLRP